MVCGKLCVQKMPIVHGYPVLFLSVPESLPLKTEWRWFIDVLAWCIRFKVPACIHMWQSRVEIKDHSVTHFDCIAVFEVPYCWTSVKGGVHTCFVDTWTIKELHLPYKTDLDVTQSHLLRRTRFSQYQASSAALGWPRDGNCYIMHRMQSGGWPYSKLGGDFSHRLFVQLFFMQLFLVQLSLVAWISTKCIWAPPLMEVQWSRSSPVRFRCCWQWTTLTRTQGIQHRTGQDNNASTGECVLKREFLWWYKPAASWTNATTNKGDCVCLFLVAVTTNVCIS